uniref:Arachidonate 12-lipoxygenase n=1 Tax=Erpetoichthys calabaricus TaxID=27687 RepID=A0A8C4X8D8_ERPCA
MATYKLFVATGTNQYAGTNDNVYATVIGKQGESGKKKLDNFGKDHCRGFPLGDIWFVELEKCSSIGDDWFCRYVEVKCPDGTCKIFPCYRWFVGNMTIRLRESSGKESHSFLTLTYFILQFIYLLNLFIQVQWKVWKSGIPKCIDAVFVQDIPPEHRFFNGKSSDFQISVAEETQTALLKLVSGSSHSPFKLKHLFSFSAYVMKHWKEDWFFGYQFLNGCNPRMIKSCRVLPVNFPVTEDMVQGTLGSNTTLCKELNAGTIYLVDYSILEGIPANKIRGKHQYITAPLCLLYEHPERGLIPLAIQIQQIPHKDNPIFLPSDSELDWLLAKMWVRHAEFQVYEALSHLLCTHLVCEVFCIATMRQLPEVHPIYKIVSTGGEGLGVFSLLVQTQVRAGTGLFQLFGLEAYLPRPTKTQESPIVHLLIILSLSHLCSFVSGIVDLFYSSDKDVMEDMELQNWIHDVVTEGFKDLPNFGLPRNIDDKKALVTILAGVIFTSSALHAAINNGQYDWCSWVPNTPCTMRCPPPPQKGLATMDLIMNTLPGIPESCIQVAITWVLSREQPVWLGQYPEDHFTEKAVKHHIDKFQEALKKIEKSIDERNANRQLKYEYLSPRKIENSVAI